MLLKESKFWPIQNAINYLDAAFYSINHTCDHGLMKAHDRREDALQIARQIYLLGGQLMSLLDDIENMEQQKKEKAKE